MRTVKLLPALKLKSIKKAKGNFTGKTYRPVDARVSPELKEFISIGARMRRQFNIKPKHIEKALRDLRKAK